MFSRKLYYKYTKQHNLLIEKSKKKKIDLAFENRGIWFDLGFAYLHSESAIDAANKQNLADGEGFVPGGDSELRTMKCGCVRPSRKTISTWNSSKYTVEPLNVLKKA